MKLVLTILLVSTGSVGLMADAAVAMPEAVRFPHWVRLTWMPALMPPSPAPIEDGLESQMLLEADGALEPGDLVAYQDGSLYDEYALEGVAGQQVDIYLESLDFDPYLILIGPRGDILAQNDDETPETHNAAISIILPMDGIYRVVANGLDRYSRGDYKLTVQAPAPDTLDEQPLTGSSD